MTPVQNRDQFATQPRNKCFLMKIDKHLEYLSIRTGLKLVLGLYLRSSGSFEQYYFEYHHFTYFG